jgi:penicillin-binding protein 1A
VIKRETAFEVHSCLEDVLEYGTGKAARAQFGLKKIPAAGKTGTAYDFTDAIFAGYDSAVTCVVWAGFDKPQKIYRGAFGRELALPVWVDVMNASVDHYPAKQIAQPPGLKKVEICSRSGLLATDQCYDSIKGASGDAVQHRTTYQEIGTQAQLPTELCNVHGEPRTRLVREAAESEFPRAASAVDLKEVRPVIPKGSTLLAARDPYNSARSLASPTPSPTPIAVMSAAPNQETASRIEAKPPDVPPKAPVPGAPVMKAIPVEPQNSQSPEIRKAVPVGPLDEVRDESILNNAATPPPADLDE